MVRWKAERTRFVFGMSIVIILLFGCGQLNQQNEIEKETTSINLDGGNPDNCRNNDKQKDYSSYLKKVWIVEDDYSGERMLSCVITDITGNEIEGYCYVGQRVLGIFNAQSRSNNNEKPNFHTVICDGAFQLEVSKLQYGEEDRTGTACLKFCEGDRIEVTLTEEGNSEQYLLRPYNILDESLRDDPTIFQIELDSWGIVNMVYANTESNHSIPNIYLTNDQGDILYNFLADFQHASEVSEVVVEDMDGDGLKDVEVITFIGSSQFEWYFFQKENGRFIWEATLMKEEGISKWIRFKQGDARKCSVD